MKKVLFVLAIIALTACGSATAPEATTDSTVVKQDSLAGGGVQVEVPAEDKHINQNAQN
jgi:hypothetical protein